ncbi:hypothetical protein FRACYDRAFT_244123 [Fragilariopsis cylindrus CCMP1102]|uniref:DUF7733 domain-containing protein n=1 Tax=Fragilariopsis cylindrus CCMP1102 TaxID=635003 RepID=A0A1E7F3V7_9STRA|nr:hypothetical protein FRACYDRAFT_244123 [Fragilariopsis cylindrus CCMP1102]|eukprot:OEU12850.1 hypothetical protein FRACYDRAFT_244123 [Fragilariopsis cylindrus CCMP1102]
MSKIIVFCVVLSAFLLSKQFIPASDAIFIVAYPAYIYLANAICFNSNELALSQKNDEGKGGATVDPLGHGQFRGKVAFTRYMIGFQVLTVLFPLSLVAFAPLEISGGAISPLVLLLAQIATEHLTKYFHDVPRFLTPVGFNVYRLKSLWHWVETAYLLVPSNHPWYYVGVTLSGINLVMWSYNLFVFLLLRTLPIYFDKVYTPPVEMAYTLVPIPKSHQN